MKRVCSEYYKHIILRDIAAMVELVDTLVLGTSAFGRGGSTPSRGTDNNNNYNSIENN